MKIDAALTMTRVHTIASRGRMYDEDAGVLFDAADLIEALKAELDSAEHALECALDDARDYERMYHEAEYELVMRAT